ncbi:Ribose methyltransferase [Coemansia biformis]|uniref:rRNA methyltransferase 1, mitochondrial n=1 Tax=Coemansia biformis TaxID=1286918 RepID=A0A9W7YHD7_9FUNG|nr:Ribose methyltransferase [Coemansia biformis]
MPSLPSQYKAKQTRAKPIVADLANSELIYGIQPVLAALQQRRREVYGLYLPSSFDSDLPRTRLEEIAWLAQRQNVPVARVPQAKLDASVGGQVHQGAVLKVSKVDPPRIKAISPFVDGSYTVTAQGCEPVTLRPRRLLPLWLCLDGIQDPRNLGSIIRSALFFGVDAVLTPHSGVCRVMPIVSKVSCGAAECTAIYRAGDMAGVLKGARKNGWSVVSATASHAPGPAPAPALVPVGEVPRLAHPTILVIGSEEAGVSEGIAALSDMNVHIPACAELPPYIDSLNAGVATGILLSSLKFEGEQQ